MLPECTIIILNISKEKQTEILISRHGKAGEGVRKHFERMYERFGLPEEDEKNTYHIKITDNMTPADTMRKVLRKLEGQNTKSITELM